MTNERLTKTTLHDFFFQEWGTAPDYLASDHLASDYLASDCLDPNSYVASQTLAMELLDSGSHGIVYPSVRRRKGSCICCFLPALVANVRQGSTYRFVWDGKPTAAIAKLQVSRTDS